MGKTEIRQKTWTADFWVSCLCAYLCTIGLVAFLSHWTGLSEPFFTWSMIAVASLGAILLFLLMTYRFAIFLCLAAGLSVTVLLLFMFQNTILAYVYSLSQSFSAWLLPFLLGQAPYNPEMEAIFFISLTLTVALLSFLLICVFKNSIILILFVASMMILLDSLTDRKISFLLLLPTAVGLIWSITLTAKNSHPKNTLPVKRTGKGYRQNLLLLAPILLSGLLFATFFTANISSGTLQSPWVKGATEDLFAALHIPLPKLQNKLPFNLGGLGYYPLYSRLGGSVTQSDAALLQVTLERSLLLRGTTYDRYDTTAWSGTGSSVANRFDSTLLSGRQQDVFDSQRPNQDLIPQNIFNAVFEEGSITISNISQQTGQVLFSPGRPTEITMPDQIIYFNLGGELFLSQAVPINQPYKVHFLQFRTTSTDFQQNLLALESYIQSHPQAEDSNDKMNAIKDKYTAANVPSVVKDYAFSLVNPDASPLEKALKIKTALLTDFTYTLEVTTPPEDRDFVEYFLETKEGYCTYFASAMTMMARSVGVPARYVEGFVAAIPGGSQGSTSLTVTGKDGHAWCEIYINGIGWIPIDATPGESESDLTNTPESMPESAPETTSDSTNSSVEVTPTPTPQANTSLTPGVVDPSSNDNTPTPQGGAAMPSTDSGNRITSWLAIFILFSLFALSLLVLFRLRQGLKKLSLLPFDQITTEMPADTALEYLLQKASIHLSILSISILPTETQTDFARRLQQIFIRERGIKEGIYCLNILQLARTYEDWRYGNNQPTPEELVKVYDECRYLSAQIQQLFKPSIFYFIQIIINLR